MGLGLRRGKPRKKKQLQSDDCDDEDEALAAGVRPKADEEDEFAVQIKQLNRRAFCDRIRLEEKLRVSFTHFLVFVLLISSFLGSRIEYDPIERIAAIHENMRQRYKAKELNDITTVNEMQGYIQEFIITSYEMASALVDANTLEPMELNRCFDAEVSDVCRLKYWSLPDYDKSLPSFVSMEDLVQDFIGPENVGTSISCANDNSKENCIDTANSTYYPITETNGLYVKTNPDFKTYGLTPEDPIIMKSRLDYPQASVIPFSPLVWMSVATKVPCDGFGNEYNSDILGAGVCKADAPCKPYSSFTNSKPAPRTNRTQQIYITYEEDAFTCVDRETLATTFWDKSWYPWATYDDFHAGREMTATMLSGEPVFYKFVPDISYLQAPIINGDVHACGCGMMPGGGAAPCADPLASSIHPMWSNTKEDNYAETCSYRRNWAKAYQATNPEHRRNTWITMNTTSFTIAVVVITPQMAGIADVVSLVTTEFIIDQVGQITASMQVRSVSDTGADWKYWIFATIIFSILFSLFSLDLRCFMSKRKREEKGNNLNKLFEVRVERPDFTSYLDLLCSIACIIQSIWAFTTELSPPNPIEELIIALQPGKTEWDFFNTVSVIIGYNNSLLMTDYAAMVVTALLFMRFCLFLALHPRLAVLVDTLVESADDMFHFMIYLIGIWLILGLFAHWQFGRVLVEYSTFDFTIWNQFLMFVGELGSAAEVKDSPIFQIYMGVFIFVTLIALMNFLLAIIMNAYTIVTDHLEDDKSEQNVVKDVFDMLLNSLLSWKHNWPATYVLWNHCVSKGKPPPINKLKPKDNQPSVKAISAEELLYAVKDEQGFPGFKSLKHAQGFIDWYSGKSGGNLLELEDKNLIRPGVYFINGMVEVTPTEEDIAELETDLRRELTSERKILGLSSRVMDQKISQYAEDCQARVDKAENSAARKASAVVHKVEEEALEAVHEAEQLAEEAENIAEDLGDGHYDGMPNEAEVLAPLAAPVARPSGEPAPEEKQTQELSPTSAGTLQKSDSAAKRKEPEPFIHSHRQSKHHQGTHKKIKKERSQKGVRKSSTFDNDNIVRAIGAMQEEMMEMHMAIIEELAELREIRDEKDLAEQPGADKQIQIGSASSTTHKEREWNAEVEIDEALNVLSTMVSKPQPRWA